MSWRERIVCGGKINLRLKVTARRPDGMHELSTLFCPVDFPADVLELVPGAALTLEVPGHPELAGPDNLVVKAAAAYAAAAGVPARWRITLDKQLPVAAGLGGGSSDAAGVLTALNRRFAALTETELALLARELGADVPFFLSRRMAWATGVGEVLEEADLPGRLPELLIVFPGFPVSARWAYTHMAPELVGAEEAAIRERFAAAFAAPECAPWAELCRNDLAPALWRKFPLLRLLRETMRSSGALAVQVSGSGSSLFALFPSGRSAAAAEQLKRDHGNLRGLRIFTGGGEWWTGRFFSIGTA